MEGASGTGIGWIDQTGSSHCPVLYSLRRARWKDLQALKHSMVILGDEIGGESPRGMVMNTPSSVSCSRLLLDEQPNVRLKRKTPRVTGIG